MPQVIIEYDEYQNYLKNKDKIKEIEFLNSLVNSLQEDLKQRGELLALYNITTKNIVNYLQNKNTELSEYLCIGVLQVDEKNGLNGYSNSEYNLAIMRFKKMIDNFKYLYEKSPDKSTKLF